MRISNNKHSGLLKLFFHSARGLFKSFLLGFQISREEITLNVNIWTGRLCYIVIAAAPRDRRHLAPPADINFNS